MPKSYTKISKSGNRQVVSLKKSTFIHVFSCRIYGLRKYKKQIKDDDTV
jgi:predicted site-specific integrase-resolvase